MAHKACRIDYVPLGVIGAIVPWNYPFHNVFQHLVAAILSGNALVVKASEHVAWSARYYQAIIDAALMATGAPAGLAQIITGAQRSNSFCAVVLSFYQNSDSCVCGVNRLHATLRALAVCPVLVEMLLRRLAQAHDSSCCLPPLAESVANDSLRS